MGPKQNPREKALENKARAEEQRNQKAAEEAERAEAATWNVGAKDNSRQKALEEKDAEKRRKAAEKQALEESEAAELGNITSKVTKPKKKGKDDFDMLNAALAQQPKTKAQKEAEQKKKEADERKQLEEQKRIDKEERKKAEEEMIRKAAAKGIVVNHTDDLMIPLNNKLDDEDNVDVTGLDNALDVLSMANNGKKSDDHPERRLKALYNAYYAQKLPQLKEEMPNLKLSQYKERIFEMWKSAPENPLNQL